MFSNPIKQDPIELSAHWKHLPFINVEFYNTKTKCWEEYPDNKLKVKQYYKATNHQTGVVGYFYVESTHLNTIKQRWDMTMRPISSPFEILFERINKTT